MLLCPQVPQPRVMDIGKPEVQEPLLVRDWGSFTHTLQTGMVSPRTVTLASILVWMPQLWPFP